MKKITKSIKNDKVQVLA